MDFHKKGAEIFIPDNEPPEFAVKRTTHMGISAHQDDLEIMAYDGIINCFTKKNQWFLGVVVTNGSGSPRNGLYAECTDDEMQKIRKLEQKKAAFIGEYTAAVLLDYKSSEVKEPDNPVIKDELKKLISGANPEIIYTHNIADKHDTHVAVAIKVIQALRELPGNLHPKKIYGCEVWRGLDWLNDDNKIIFDTSRNPNLASALIEIFDSQISGGKRYDKAAIGRRLSNATYLESHKTDETDSIVYGIDLTPLIKNADMDIADYLKGFLKRFEDEAVGRIKRFSL